MNFCTIKKNCSSIDEAAAIDNSSISETHSQIDDDERIIDEIFSSNDELESSIDERKFGLDAVKQLFTSSFAGDTNLYKLDNNGNNNFSINSTSSNSTSSNLQENFGSKFSSEMDWNLNGSNKNNLNIFSGSCSHSASIEKIKQELIIKWLGGRYE